MRYIVGGESFTKINIATGTIQNASKINIVEVSNTTVEGSGVLLAPFEKFLFAGEGDLYARCADGAGAEVLTVPFEVAEKGGGAVDAISANAFQSLQTTGSTVNFLNGGGSIVGSFSFPDIVFIGSASSTVEGAFWLEVED